MDETATNDGGGSRDLRARVSGGGPVLYFLVGADRRLVAGGFLCLGYALLVGLSVFGPGSAATFEPRDPVATLFSSFVVAVVMGVTLVLTFNQLVLSQELGPLGEQREQMDASMAFREAVEETVGDAPSPVEPAAFFRRLVLATNDHAEAFRTAVDADADGADAARRYAEGVVADTERVAASLAGEEFGTFGVVRAALCFDYSAEIHRGRELRHRYGTTLSPEASGALDDLLESLELFAPAREHVKTLYFRWEIVELSRTLIYVSVPALAAVAYAVVAFQPAEVAGTTLGVRNSLLAVAGLFAVGSAPFAVFLSHILRIVSVAKWTLADGPFVLRSTDGETTLAAEAER